jgi:hypothetical protein
MRVWLPHFRQVTTTWGSLRGFIRTRLLVPGTKNVLQFLQMLRLYAVGKRILAAIAIFRAIPM